MSQTDKANRFRALHTPGDPLGLYNIWDAGSARAVARSGAPAIATGSWSVAAAQGYEDGEALPLDLLLTIVRRITQSVDLPVSVDFEGGYAAAPDALAAHVVRLLEAGAIGINFEDRIVQGSGLYPMAEQVARIRAIRDAADAFGVPLFINARTDLFLGSPPDSHAARLPDAIARAAAYADAGADGFFVPGLIDKEQIATITGATPLPVNVMM
ncbi:MAG: isocitrate lyase/phosphoenolpyruvate mutase family protein, partial [Marinibacterium sp.]|nr:isocitrate lyase/phosphoenolpyruvate mutase family protein [Marinibacterium sp.]